MTQTAPTLNWREVEAALADEIRDGVLAPGQRLPAEPALMARFGVGRHSVRRALAALEAAGLLRARQGSGTYVREAPVLDYRLSNRTRFSGNLLGQGREPGGALLRHRLVLPPPGVAQALRLPPGEMAHNLLRLGLADGVPLLVSDAWYPARRFPGLPEAWRPEEGTSAMLARHGIGDYRRVASTVMTRLPTEEEAGWLDQAGTAPVLVVRKVDADLAGVPIAFSETVWAGERVQLSVEHGHGDDAGEFGDVAF